MRVDWFWIEDYKNLKDLVIDFDQDQWITVLIGWNGTGKSNVIEALTIVFRDLIMGQNSDGAKNRPSLRYKLRYRCRGSWIQIDADPGRRRPYQIRVAPTDIEHNETKQITPELDIGEIAGKSIRISELIQSKNGYLPEYVFGYYSGESDRLHNVFEKYVEKFDKALRGGKDPGLKRLFYALPVHSNFVLLSFLINDTELTNSFLRDQLGLEEGGIESVLFVLRQPSWKSDEGDDRFWNAKGIVSDFLARLYDLSLAPIRIKRKDTSTRWNRPTREYLYLYIKDLEALRDIASEQTAGEFFQDLESTHVSELIEEVRIRIKLKKNDGTITFRELSEGEQQLLTVLGLLKFTAEEESLFLLDEPDTHLNPRWSADYLQHLQNFVSNDEGTQDNSHIILTTHNPLAVAELEKEQVQILMRDKDDLSVTAQSPDTHPRGMGYAGVVTSEMFGLDAALDSHTQQLLEEKRELVATEGDLTKSEIKQLSELNQQLEEYGFRYEMRDPVLTEYMKARYQFDRGQPKGATMSDLTEDERAEKARKLVEQALSNVEQES